MGETNWSETFAEEVEELRRVRDELRVQIHLARAEARERWEDLEKRWQHLEGKLRVLRAESRDSLGEIGEAGRLLADEIRKGYRHLRSLL